ncbi:MAG: hypothetical protein Rpha_1821 [Candidatus Ruthia sp. Apha_13_S6]|nr:hypothetical protein [Candidatus Ruthia sp. Apha_13_S6]
MLELLFELQRTTKGRKNTRGVYLFQSCELTENYTQINEVTKIKASLSYLEKRRGLLPTTKWNGESDNQYICRLRKLQAIDKKDSLTIELN